MCQIVVDQLITANVLQEVIFSKVGVPLAGGVIYFYRQQDQTTFKNVYYQDVTGVSPTYVAAPNPMTLSATGSFVDVNGNDTLLFFYPYLDIDFPIEICNPNKVDYYYIEVYDNQSNLQFTREFFPFLPDLPGPSPTEAVNTLENYVVNNRFWRNLGEQYQYSTSISLSTLPNEYTAYQYNATGNFWYITLAPSQHDGFSMPDFNYVRNVNTGVTEQTAFVKFPYNNVPTIIGDIQPEWYINHQCSADSSGATLKAYQFPITLHQATLSNQPFSFSIQGISNSGSTAITILLYAFNGTGASSVSSLVAPLGTINLTTAWTKWTLPALTFPPVGAINGTGDDAFYLQINMPTGSGTAAVCNLSFCLPSLYLSSTDESLPTNEFQTYDQIDAIVAAPRTGDIKTSLNNFYPYGWVPMNGGTICNVGNITTPTNGAGIAYQATDAWKLYYLLWTHFKAYDNAGVNPIAQMYDSAGATTAYGTQAYVDWNNLKQLAITNIMGKMIMGTVPPLALPVIYNSTFTASQITTTGGTATSGSSPLALVITASQPVAFGEVIQITAAGTKPTNINLNTNYWCAPQSSTTFLVYTSLANLQSGLAVVVGATGGATMTIVSQSLVLTMTNSATPATINCYTGMPVTFSTTGSLPGGLAAGVVYYASQTGLQVQSTTICIASSFTNAIQGSLIAYSSVGTPPNTISVALAGTNAGEYQHDQLQSELAPHYHRPNTLPTNDGGPTFITNATGASGFNLTGSAAVINTQSFTSTVGGGSPFNVTQPGTYMNMYIKL